LKEKTKSGYPWVVVERERGGGREESIGLLYFQNERVTVLLNGIVDSTDLGPLKNLHKKYTDFEAHMIILPTSEVEIVHTLEIKK